ncbi:N-6 DNA methylase [Candidatus Wirthbacteria bacterium CG2_30_54_11]|uniref:site-specific DNA-methyltransferase (adenine-specific) n=1 Tax=Candidatus Wirthbacteria bacterium CG2_30_54_11 TaxID=1817892 RepID=A0A1J5ITL2_9BACT|nr:MAG: N-6 DNA methylase [Candidatus Wirthbacteria bacterium CG2_30_54_11]
MNTDIKRHIDAARQVLVGVVPNPTSQIDQITNALIYKFMDDMDQAAMRAGGDASFFVGDLERYAWTRLMDPRMGNQERMNLYGEALLKFSESKQLPELFRDIFKSAILPYRSPEVLGLFLKEVAYFDYSHPEDLGDAYEYLLSIMSSQGDAGQFRTPRHIIDFVVDVVNPSKDDRVLDPACGTGGFLVSSYKHILEKHDGPSEAERRRDGKNPDGTSNSEKSLTPSDRQVLMKNFEGYDIDPGMVRIAQVNMYLHQFRNPRIYQYDTLSMDERWNEKYDVILANPPFMSPKGGVKTHSKFSIQSSRSEVLFVDYIMNHLRPRGRAGIIVPEGIIFQSGSAHRQLRKNLVEDGLYAVVSLPSGVFAPYAGVKTSILFLDNELAKQKQEILFVKVENDGYDLGATKRPISKNDLPGALEILKAYQALSEVEMSDGVVSLAVPRSRIAEIGDYNLSGDRYQVAIDYSNAKYPMVGFDEVVSTITPPVKIPKEHFNPKGNFPIIDQSQNDIAGWTNDESALVKSEKPVVIFGDHTCAVKYSEKSFAQGADGIKILLTDDRLIPKFFYYILKTKPVESEGYQRHFAKLKRYKIPLPPLEIQQQIIAELDGYQSIISGAQQVVESWKPRIEIDPEWEKAKLGDMLDRVGEQVDPQKITGEIYYIGLENIESGSGRIVGEPTTNYEQIKSLKNVFQPGDLLYGKLRPNLNKVWLAHRNGICSTDIVVFRVKQDAIANFYWYLLLSDDFVSDVMTGIKGAQLPRVGYEHLKEIILPLPPLAIQQQIVDRIEAERALVEGNRRLIEIYEEKVKQTIARLWEE